MITPENVNSAVDSVVKRALDGVFDYAVPIVDEDVKEPIVRPSLKFAFDGVTGGLWNSSYREQNITCRIYFFAKNGREPKYENLKVQEALSEAFMHGLEIRGGFIVPVDEFNAQVVDSVLECSFGITILERLPDTDESELMEELELRTGEEDNYMAVSMPSIEVIFKQLAGSLIERSARSIAVLIVKDDTNTAFTHKTYKDATEATEDKELYTPENLRAIKDVLTFGVSKCCVFRIDEDGTLNDALKLIQKTAATGWITIAGGTQEEFDDLASWVKARELERKSYKAVVYKVNVTDCKHLVNFWNDAVVFADERGEQPGGAYCPSLIGILASCNIKKGSTYYICSNLTAVTEADDNDAAVKAGRFVLFNDDTDVRVALGINTLTTTDGIYNTEDMKFIDTIEAMDLISDDISKVFKETYIGKYKNNYDNQVLFISAINTYFKELAGDYVLDNNYGNRAEVDIAAQRLAWLGVGKAEAADWDEQTVRNNTFKRTVYLAGDIKILGAMENLKFTVSLC